MSEQIDRVHLLTEHGKALFAGEQPEVVGAALADLLAIWLTSHHADNPKRTQGLRKQMLAFHLKGVLRLLDFYSRKETDNE